MQVKQFASLAVVGYIGLCPLVCGCVNSHCSNDLFFFRLIFTIKIYNGRWLCSGKTGPQIYCAEIICIYSGSTNNFPFIGEFYSVSGFKYYIGRRRHIYVTNLE